MTDPGPEERRHATVIAGSTELPSGFDHPHASEEARRIAQDGLILRVQVGSGVHGTSIQGQDDRDEMGICLEPAAFVTGLARVPSGTLGPAPAIRFEQFERHTVWDEPGGLANRSGPGDLDVIVYSARKWARLALGGNPTVLLVLFVPDVEVVYRNDVGAELVDNAHRFVSKVAAGSTCGSSTGRTTWTRSTSCATGTWAANGTSRSASTGWGWMRSPASSGTSRCGGCTRRCSPSWPWSRSRSTHGSDRVGLGT
jgi:hypothetical protein